MTGTSRSGILQFFEVGAQAGALGPHSPVGTSQFEFTSSRHQSPSLLPVFAAFLQNALVFKAFFLLLFYHLFSVYLNTSCSQAWNGHGWTCSGAARFPPCLGMWVLNCYFLFFFMTDRQHPALEGRRTARVVVLRDSESSWNQKAPQADFWRQRILELLQS